MNSRRQANIFHFKKFSLHHDRVALKVGTDAVLLGAWVNVHGSKRILDIGTGSGIIALMLAQRTEETVTIDAVEIEKNDATQATENVLQSPWSTRVRVRQTAIQEFVPDHQYDLIVSNPPYFLNSLHSPNRQRTLARHAQTLNAEELIDHSLRLLHPNGRLAVILPLVEGNNFKAIASKHLHLVRETAFFSRNEKPQERWLFEFSFAAGEVKSDSLVLYDSAGQKTEAYVNLTKDFYL